jgi:hypothetical protein
MPTYSGQIGPGTLAIRCRVDNTITSSSNPWRLRLRAEYQWSIEDLGVCIC